MIKINNFNSLLFCKTLMEGLNFKIERPIVFFDLETTGVSTVDDRIIELAAIKYIPKKKNPEIKTIRVNPEVKIPKEASDVHGITDEIVKDLPVFKKYAKSIHAYFKDCDLGGYNLKNFDIPLLFSEFNRAGICEIWDFKIIDPLKMWHEKEPRTLAGAMNYYCNEELVDAHAAEVDILATIKVAIAQKDAYNLETPFMDIDTIDVDNKLIMKDGVPFYNFGKHKGSAVLKNIGYAEWMLTSPSFHWHTKKCITDIINGNF